MPNKTYQNAWKWHENSSKYNQIWIYQLQHRNMWEACVICYCWWWLKQGVGWECSWIGGWCVFLGGILVVYKLKMLVKVLERWGTNGRTSIVVSVLKLKGRRGRLLWVENPPLRIWQNIIKHWGFNERGLYWGGVLS